MIELGVASSALHGRSGDRAVVARHGDRTLVAAIDGLGHGEAAAEAADAAASILERDGGSLQGLLGRCHEALRGTRGAVMTLAELVNVIDAVDATQVTVLSVLVEAWLGSPPDVAVATPAAIVAITVPPVVIPVTATV